MVDIEPSQVTSSDVDGVRVVRASGEFDFANLQQLRDPLLGAMATGGEVVLDMSDTTFMDSSVIGLLAEARGRAIVGGGFFRIAAPSDQVRRTLALVALDAIIEMHPSVDEALKTPRA